MGITFTPNLALPLPDGNDSVANGPADFAYIANKLDQGTSGPVASLYQKGPLASRPAANTVTLGGVYHCTDASCMFISDGTNWHYQPLDGTSQPVGAMTAYAGTTDPVDPDGTSRWVITDGRALSRATYASLFSAIGVAYGAGDGSTTFNIPNSAQKFMLGKSASGTGGAMGSTGGQIDHSHSVPGLLVPAHYHGAGTLATGFAGGHNHQFNAGSAIPIAGTWSFKSFAEGADNYCPYSVGSVPSGRTATDSVADHVHSMTGSAGATGSGTSGDSSFSTGTGTTGTTNPPYLTVQYIIKIK